MKTFLLYTLARVALFAAAFGLIWLAFGHWLQWGAVSALYTAIIAMVVSSVVALLVLGSLRDEFAVEVAARADRAKAAYEARRAAEDVDPAGSEQSAAPPAEPPAAPPVTPPSAPPAVPPPVPPAVPPAGPPTAPPSGSPAEEH